MEKTLTFRPEGETENIYFEWGAICGKQQKPSIGLSFPDKEIGWRNSVMKHEDVDRLIDFLVYWQKKFKRVGKV